MPGPLPFLDPRMLLAGGQWAATGPEPLPGESNLAFGLRRMPQQVLEGIGGTAANITNFGDYPRRVEEMGQGLWNTWGVPGAPGAIAQAFNYGMAPVVPPAAAASAPVTAASAKAKGPAGPKGPTRAQGPVFAFQGLPGDRQTSGYRDPGHNRKVGGVSGSYHTRKDSQGNPMATDRVPPKGMGMAEYANQLRRMNPHLDVINEGDHVHMEPRPGSPMNLQPGPNVQANQTAQAIAGFRPPPGPDMTGFNEMDSALNQIEQNRMTPFSATYKQPDMPDLPTPELQKPTDFSAGDAAFEASRPTNPFGATGEEQEKGKLRMRRAEYFSGLGQALASFKDGEGLGSLFARLGGMALQGAMQGDEKVRTTLEKFDNAMVGFNRALASRDDGKAREFAQVAANNINTMNQHRHNQFQLDWKEAEKLNPQFIDGNLITFDKDENGNVTRTQTPVDPSLRNATILQRAQNEIGRSAAKDESSQLQWKFDTAMAGQNLDAAQRDAIENGPPDQRNQALMTRAFDAALPWVAQGRWENEMNKFAPDTVKKIKKDVYGKFGLRTTPDGRLAEPIPEGLLDDVNEAIAGAVVPVMINNKKMHVLTGGTTAMFENKPGGKELPNTRRTRGPDVGVVSAEQAARAGNRRTTVRTKQGNTTTTVAERVQ